MELIAVKCVEPFAPYGKGCWRAIIEYRPWPHWASLKSRYAKVYCCVQDAMIWRRMDNDTELPLYIATHLTITVMEKEIKQHIDMINDSLDEMQQHITHQAN